MTWRTLRSISAASRVPADRRSGLPACGRSSSARKTAKESIGRGPRPSGRTACRCLRLARSSFQYRQRPPTAERTRLVQRLHELSRKYPRYGFRRIAVKLRREGDQVGRKQVQKLRRAEGKRQKGSGFKY
ncbi:MAG: transposase [Opitutus sp.]|nr:transposase [Opitutus sp.]